MWRRPVATVMIEFCAAIWRDNLMATQFHPEKSQDIGLNIFKNFGDAVNDHSPGN